MEAAHSELNELVKHRLPPVNSVELTSSLISCHAAVEQQAVEPPNCVFACFRSRSEGQASTHAWQAQLFAGLKRGETGNRPAFSHLRGGPNIQFLVNVSLVECFHWLFRPGGSNGDSIRSSGSISASGMSTGSSLGSSDGEN